MTSLRRVFALLAGAVLATASAALIAAPAHAADPTYTDWVDVSVGGPTELFGTITVPKFDPSLGTLLGVELRQGGSVQSSVTFTNDAAGPQVFGFSSSLTASSSSSAAPAATAGADLFDFPPTVIASGATVDLGSVFVDFPETAQNLAPAGWIGPGDVTFDVSTQTTNTQTGGGGNILISQSTSATYTVSYRYLYQPVEEPALIEVTPVAPSVPAAACGQSETAVLAQTPGITYTSTQAGSVVTGVAQADPGFVLAVGAPSVFTVTLSNAVTPCGSGDGVALAEAGAPSLLPLGAGAVLVIAAGVALLTARRASAGRSD